MHMLALLSLKQLHPATPRARRIVMLCLQRPSLLRQFEGQHLANLLWGLTRSGFRPLPAFLDLMAQVGWRPAALLYGIHPAGQPWRLCANRTVLLTGYYPAC